MNLGTLIITIAAVAFVITLAVGTLFKRHKNWLMTYLQNFAGVLFVFSGFVKAIDPLGTAYKMEQYFAEFQTTFADSFLSFLAPMFPWLASVSTEFAIGVIVFEILLGLMLLLGSKSKFNSWAFLLLVAFFTFLTGFTYLTGYVPSDVNFFSFSEWGPYDELQMKVTDCGCFGDFLLLEPKISFMKDLVLLLPALFFVFRHRDMHQLFSSKTRGVILGIATVALSLYCIRNAYWNLPHTDFRPFKSGVNIAEKKAAEEKAEADREIISYKLKNSLTGKYVVLPYNQYMKEYKSYPKTDWEIVESIMSEPAIPETKISEFIIYGPSDEDVTEQILNNPNYFMLFICHKLYYNGSTEETMTVTDTISRVDTLIEGMDTTFTLNQDLVENQAKVKRFQWDVDYLRRFSDVVVPLANSAKTEDVNSIIVLGGADQEMINDFKRVTGINFTVCTADDILLKTIVRSNPGIILMKSGKLIAKWHYSKMPDWPDIKNTYIH